MRTDVSAAVEPTTIDGGPGLLDALRAGDEAAFAMIVDAWSPAMMHVSRRYVHTAQSAEDVVQETWLAVIQSLERFEGRSTLRTWVFGILVNTARTRAVKEARVVPVSDLADGQPTVDPGRFAPAHAPNAGAWTAAGAPRTWEPSPESAAIAHETRHLVLAAISSLPEPQRTVIALRDVDGLAAEEICLLLDITAVHQRVLLHRARAKVRQALEDYYREGPGQ